MHVKCLLALSLTHAMLSMLSDKVLEIFSIMAENTKGELKCAGLVTCVSFSLSDSLWQKVWQNMASEHDSEQVQCPLQPHWGKAKSDLKGYGRASGLQISCSLFSFFQFHYENTRAQFFVEDASTASALKAVNHKIQDGENRRVCEQRAWHGTVGADALKGTKSRCWSLGFPQVYSCFSAFSSDIYFHQLFCSTLHCTEWTEAWTSRAAQGKAGSSGMVHQPWLLHQWPLSPLFSFL